MQEILNAIKTIFLELTPERTYLSQISLKEDTLAIQGKKVTFNPKGNIYLLAMGKAAAFEAKVIDKIFKTSTLKITQGLVITKYGHNIPNLPFKTIEASHPIVDENSLMAGKEALQFVNQLGEEDFLIFCLSGGASALVELYQGDLSLKEMQQINKTLLESGIGIEDFNLIRKSVSQIKNGGLFRKLKCPSVSLITCDIPSGDLNSVSSAPSLYTPIEQSKVNQLLNQYLPKEMAQLISKNIHLTQNKYSKGKVFKIADSLYLGELATKHFENYNVITPPFDSRLDIELPKLLKTLKKGKINISLGELNIKVQGGGLGGRNTHFVLTLAYELFYKNVLKLNEEETQNLFILSVGTDGNDGPTDAAGAYFSYTEFKKTPIQTIEEELSKFDSYHFFLKLGTLIKTGPTGTNLMDLRLINL